MGFDAATAAATAGGAPPIDPSKADERVKDKTVAQIIDQWNQDMEQHVSAFAVQAAEVKKWDEIMHANLHKIRELEYGVSVVKSYQEELAKKLEQVGMSQKDHTLLIEKMEEQIRRQESEKSGVAAEGEDMKREEAYKLAEDIDKELTKMKNNLKDVTTKVNNSSSVAQSKARGGAAQHIIKILNFQMDSLSWIERKTTELESRLITADQGLNQAGASQR